MLLPFDGVPVPDEIELHLPKQQPTMLIPSSGSSEEPLSSSDSSDEDRDYRQEETDSVAKYIYIPLRHDGWQDNHDSVDLPDFGSRQPLHWGKRKRRPPDRLRGSSNK